MRMFFEDILTTKQLKPTSWFWIVYSFTKQRKLSREFRTTDESKLWNTFRNTTFFQSFHILPLVLQNRMCIIVDCLQCWKAKEIYYKEEAKKTYPFVIFKKNLFDTALCN